MNSTGSHKKKSPSSNRRSRSKEALLAKKRSGRCVTSTRNRIEADTPIVPLWIAEWVVAEAERYSGEVFPDGYSHWLVEKADACYAGNPRFRRHMRGHGNAGRDWLRVFMRHWLAAILKYERPDLFIYFPPDWVLGHRLTGRRTHDRQIFLSFLPASRSWPRGERPNPLFRSGRLQPRK